MSQTPYRTLYHPGREAALTWHIDRFLLAATDPEGRLGIWDVSTGHRVAIFTPKVHASLDYNIRWSPDGSHLTVITDDARLCVWHTSTGNTFITSKQPSLRAIDTVAWPPDKQRIASGGRSGRGVQVWDANNGHLITTLECPNQFAYELIWSGDSSSLASELIHIWKARSRRCVATDSGAVTGVAWPADGPRFRVHRYESAVRAWQVF